MGQTEARHRPLLPRATRWQTSQQPGALKDPIVYYTTPSIVNLNQPVRVLVISCHIHAVRMIVAQIFK